MSLIREVLSLIPTKEKLLSVSELYHENTKLWPHQVPEQQELDTKILTGMANAFRVYETVKRVPLKKEFEVSKYSVEEAIQRRRSIRHYSGEVMALDEVAKLLYLANGITGSWQMDNVTFSLRAAPSAGALYPIELYPVLFNVRDILSGVYHYNAKEHSLELIAKGDYREDFYDYTFRQEMILTASAVILLAVIFQRTKIKYGERGYRYALLDAGHIGENVYLSATAMGLGCVSIGGFYDDEVNRLLSIDGVDEAVIYMLVLGKIKGA